MSDRVGHRGVALLSEHHLLRDGLVALLRAAGVDDLVEFTSADQLLFAARSAPPRILLVDLDHESGDSLALVRRLRHALPDTSLVVLGTALRQGAVESLVAPGLETPSAGGGVLATAVSGTAAMGGGAVSEAVLSQRRRWARLTPRQRDVLRWLPSGADNRTIARHLGVGERAIKAHITSLLEEMGVDNRTQLAVLADRAGLRPPARSDAD